MCSSASYISKLISDANGNDLDSEMLANIDQLYTVLLDRNGLEAAYAAAVDAAAPAAVDDNVGAAMCCADSKDEMHNGENVASDFSQEQLLTTIDQLYDKVLGNTDDEKHCEQVGNDASQYDNDNQVQLNGLRQDLEEVLWSALFMKRGAGDRIDVQAKLFELVPAKSLVQSLRACGGRTIMAPSLLQRLAAELPRVHAVTTEAGGCAGNAEVTTSISELVRVIRDARDNLLSLASAVNVSSTNMPDESADGGKTPEDATEPEKTSKRPPRKPPRRTALSHWMADDLVAKDRSAK
jgi:hypothetical protein